MMMKLAVVVVHSAVVAVFDAEVTMVVTALFVAVVKIYQWSLFLERDIELLKSQLPLVTIHFVETLVLLQ
jgi:hypothetical protein